ncbi:MULTISPECIES: hypothetical protein [Bradyrhizobium]|uniref:Uncharacterized protein n=1 Tax=Bradyrhizobium septentrionale TaxID=1404411 RepID=A0ABZ2P864_9BRAD|nr:hypothetical protein [Bradyrhizobium sp. 2S1]MCK7672218.1 hypothetical protein [Bradyrhizobium sp. 2S1]
MATVNISVANDADFFRSFLYRTLSGDPIDLTGATFVMKARRHAQDATAFLTLSTDTGEIDIADGPGGSFTVLITRERLLEMTIGPYDQSLVMTLNGVKQQLWSGVLTVNPGPSR